MRLYNNSIKEKMSVSTLILLIVCDASNGFADFSQKLFIKQLADIPVSVFNFYTYIISSVVLGGFYVIFSIKEGLYVAED